MYRTLVWAFTPASFAPATLEGGTVIVAAGVSA
jgi:hypothetical protein